MVNPLEQNDIDLESSILHYFIWKVANLTATTRNNSKSINCSTTKCVNQGASNSAVSTTSLSSDSLLSKYNKIIEVMQTELNHVDVLDCVIKSHDNKSNYPTIYNLWKTCHSYQYIDTAHLDNKECNASSTYCDCNSVGTDDTDVTITKMKPTTKKARIEDFPFTSANISLVSQMKGSFESPVDSNHLIANEFQAGSHSKCSTVQYKRVSLIRCLDSNKSTIKDDTKEKDVSGISSSNKEEYELIAEKGIVTTGNTCQIPSPKCRTEQEGEKRTKSKKAHALTWSERFDQLVQFHKEHDHFIIPRDCKKYPWLWDWVYYQRKNYSSNKLKKERVDKLNSIGFDWESPFALKKFETRIADCTKLKETSVVDTVVSSTQRTEEEKDRRKQDKNSNKFLSSAQSIREEYMRRLGVSTINDNNVCEDMSTILDKRFADRATELKLIKDICGTVNQKKCILAIFPNNTALLQWIKKQRIQYQLLKKGQPTTLTGCRKEILDELGFDFEPRSNHNIPITSISSKKERIVDTNETLDK